MTFSIVARCRTSGMFGVAVCSSSPAVAARCAFARAGIGAATSQNITDPTLGPSILQALTIGVGAQRALDNLVATQPDIAYRQMTVVDAFGESAVFSGSRTLGVHAAAKAQDVAAAGNMLASEGVRHVSSYKGAATVDVQALSPRVAAERTRKLLYRRDHQGFVPNEKNDAERQGKQQQRASKAQDELRGGACSTRKHHIATEEHKEITSSDRRGACTTLTAADRRRTK